MPWVKSGLIAVLGVLALAGEARAWGDTGHQVICELTIRLVAPATRSQMEELIRLDGEFSSFVEACSWADHPRKRGPEHFVNLPRDATGLTGATCGEARECVVSAINKDSEILASKQADAKSRAVALKFLGHWTGDVHQPLHVSFADDRGGNDIRVNGDCSANLHAAWDSCLVQKAVGDNVDAAVRDLLGSLTSSQHSQWAAGTATDWANETFALAVRPETQYCSRQGLTCIRPVGSVRIDQAYLAVNVPVVRQQLLKAAVRLAAQLDRAFIRYSAR